MLVTLVQLWDIQCGAGVLDFLPMKSSGHLAQPIKRKGFVVLLLSRFFFVTLWPVILFEDTRLEISTVLRVRF